MAGSHARSNLTATRFLLIGAAVLLLGFALRSYRLDAKNIWVDEAHPWWFASLPLFQSISLGFSGGAINSGADPLFNILLHFWIELAGDSLYSLRYLSVITNLIGVAYLGRAAGRMFGHKASLLALAIGSIAPIWVFYSQEVRPYAFTPALMLVMVDAVIRLDRDNPRKVWPWVVLVCGEALSVYTHGFMIVAVAAINGWLAFLALRRYRRAGTGGWIGRWLLSQVAAGLLLLPLLPVNLARAGGIMNPFATPLTAPQFASELWSYLMGIPWEDVFDPIPLRFILVLLLVVVALGLIVALRGEGSRWLADLVWLTLAISLLTLLYSWRDPSFHPRYVLFLSGPLFLIVAAVLLSLWEALRGWRMLGMALAALIVVASVFSIDNLYVGRYRGYRHPSTRAVAETLRKDFGPQDAVVVVAPHDFTLNYNGTGDVPIVWSRFDEGIERPAEVLQFLQNRQKIGVLRNTNERSDSRRILPFYLERYGKLVERQLFEGYDLSFYELDPGANLQLASFEPVDFTWGALSVKGVSIGSGDAVTVVLQWNANALFTPGTRYAASIRLVDPVTQWQIGGADSLLLADNGDPTERWQPGQATTQYFVIPLQPGTPPISADLLVTLYEAQTGRVLDLRDAAGAPAGQQAMIGSVVLGRAPETWAYDENQRLWHLQSLDTDVLRGFVADKMVISPGGVLGVTLAWAKPLVAIQGSRISIQVVQDSLMIAGDDGPILQGRPTAEVPPGQPWLDRRLLHIRGDAHPGTAALQVLVGDQTIKLADLQVVGFERLMQRPLVERPFEATFGTAIRLLGYKLEAPDPLTSASTVNLTLYWQALAEGSPEANYKVFTQILAADGHLVGQHDGVPVNGTRPCSGWLTGEYVIDLHPMIFNGPYAGPIHIQLGLYDPVTLQRVLTDSGSDAVVLPEQLVVESTK